MVGEHAARDEGGWLARRARVEYNTILVWPFGLVHLLNMCFGQIWQNFGGMAIWQFGYFQPNDHVGI